MYSNNISDTHERWQLLLLVCEESDWDAAIIWITGVPRLLVVHWRVHNLEQLPVKVFLWMWTRSINHYSIQVVQVSVAETCLRQWSVGSECRRLGLRSFLLWCLVCTRRCTYANVRQVRCSASLNIGRIHGTSFLWFVFRAFRPTTLRLLLQHWHNFNLN